MYISPFDKIANDKKEIQETVSKGKSLFRYCDNVISFEEWINMLITYIEEVQAKESAATRKLEEFNKDKEIQYWKNKYNKLENEIKNSFLLTEKQTKAINEWKDKHNKKYHPQCGGAVGGRYTYTFTPTAIGTIGVCKCESCQTDAEFVFQDLA